MTFCNVDLGTEQQISVLVKKWLRRSGPMNLAAVLEKLNAELGGVLCREQVLHILHTSAKHGIPRFAVDGGMVDLMQTTGRPLHGHFTSDGQKQISVATKKMLVHSCKPMSLQEVISILQGRLKCIIGREEVLQALQTSAKQGVPRFQIAGDVVTLVQHLKRSFSHQREASKELSRFLRQDDFNMRPWHQVMGLQQFEGNGALVIVMIASWVNVRMKNQQPPAPHSAKRPQFRIPV